MVSDKEIAEMARANAECAVDQRGNDADSVADYALNVRDTLAEWGVAQPRLVGMSALHGAGAATCRALSVYYARVAELLAQAKS